MKTQISNDEQLVLDYFGLEEKDFPELARSVDFEALAKQIRNPTKTAVCNVLDGEGKIVADGEGPVRVHIEVAVSNAEKILAEKSLRFIEWF